jgi:hypothetical protein
VLSPKLSIRPNPVRRSSNAGVESGHDRKDRFMPKYALSFRAPKVRTLNPAEEAAWGEWFGKIGASIADFGNRVGQTSALGNCGADTTLGGYTLINAEDLEAAVSLAKGCPGLQQGGGVEVGTIIEMG